MKLTVKQTIQLPGKTISNEISYEPNSPESALDVSQPDVQEYALETLKEMIGLIIPKEVKK